MAGGNTTSVDEDNLAMKGPGSESVYPRPEQTDKPNLETMPPPKKPTHLVGGGAGVTSDGGWTTYGITTGFNRAGE
jgi:hypothetical protein